MPTDTKHFTSDFTQMKLSPEDVKSLKDPNATGDGWGGFSYTNNEVGGAGGAQMQMEFL